MDAILAGKEVAGAVHPFRQMCRSWRWLIVSEQVEKWFPDLPLQWSSVLNNRHAANRQKREMEVMMELASNFCRSKSWDTAASLVVQGEPQCAGYMPWLIKFVKFYGGGQSATESESFPLIRYLQLWATTYGSMQGSVVLGHEYCVAVIDGAFQAGVGSLFPFMRTALFATNLTALPAKIVDGISKLITKSDVQRLAAKDKTEDMLFSEALMAKAWTQTNKALLDNPALKPATAFGAFGKLQTRLVLQLLQKQKHGREPKGFDSFAQIETLWQKDLAKLLATAAEPAVAHAPAAADAACTVEEVQKKDKIALQEHKHLKIGELYVKQGSTKAFKLVSVSETGAKFEHVPLLPGICECIETNWKAKDAAGRAEIKLWRPFKGDLPQKIQQAAAIVLMPHHSTSMQMERLRCEVQASLNRSVYQQPFPAADWHFCCFPNMLCARVEAPADSLKLLPAGHATAIKEDQIDRRKSALAQTIVRAQDDDGSVHYYQLQLPSQRLNWKSDDPAKWSKNNEKSILLPFSWVKPTSDAETANMTLHFEILDEYLTIPVFKNHKTVKKHEALYVLDDSLKEASAAAWTPDPHSPPPKKRKVIK